MYLMGRGSVWWGGARWLTAINVDGSLLQRGNGFLSCVLFNGSKKGKNIIRFGRILGISKDSMEHKWRPV